MVLCCRIWCSGGTALGKDGTGARGKTAGYFLVCVPPSQNQMPRGNQIRETISVTYNSNSFISTLVASSVVNATRKPSI